MPPPPYQVLIPRGAREDLQRLDPDTQDAALDALEYELEEKAAAAPSFRVDGRIYLKVPLLDGLEAVVYRLDDDEIRRRSRDRTVELRPGRVYMVLELQRRPLHATA